MWSVCLLALLVTTGVLSDESFKWTADLELSRKAAQQGAEVVRAVAASGVVGGVANIVANETAETCISKETCRTRSFLDGSVRIAPRVVMPASAFVRFMHHSAPQLRPNDEARQTIYLAHMLTVYQGDLGISGSLAAFGCSTSNTTRLFWGTVMLGRRQGERVISCRSHNKAANAPLLVPPGLRARWLFLAGAASVNSVFRELVASSCALIPGGLLVVDGLNDMHERPHIQEGFHRFMLGVRELEGMQGCESYSLELEPFLRIGSSIVLSQPAFAQAYRSVFRVSLPPLTFVSHQKFMHSADMLIPQTTGLPESTAKSICGIEDILAAESTWVLAAQRKQGTGRPSYFEDEIKARHDRASALDDRILPDSSPKRSQ